MKLCLLTGEYPPMPGGVGDYTRRLGEALRARGHEVVAVTIQDGRLVGYGSEYRPTFLAPPSEALDWSLRAWRPLVGALDALRPDWLHIQYQTGAYAMKPGVNFLPWRLKQLRPGLSLAVTFHDLLVPYLFPKAGPLRAWVNRRLAQDVDAVVATNAADAAVLKGYRARRAGSSPHLIPIGSNIAVNPPSGYARELWRASLGVSPGEQLVAYFGLLSPSKGAEVLLAALARLDQPWRLLLIGGAATAPQDLAYAEAFRRRLAAGGMAQRVVITGHVPDQEVSAYLLAADCVALPFLDGASFRRGSLLAALSHARPVITTQPADHTTGAALEGSVLLVPPGDAEALALALARLAAEPGLSATLARAGQALAVRFSWEAIAAAHEQLYGPVQR